MGTTNQPTDQLLIFHFKTDQNETNVYERFQSVRFGICFAFARTVICTD